MCSSVRVRSYVNTAHNIWSSKSIHKKRILRISENKPQQKKHVHCALDVELCVICLESDMRLRLNTVITKMNLSPQFAAFSSLLTSQRSHTYIHAHSFTEYCEKRNNLMFFFSTIALYYCGFKNLVVRQSSHRYTCAHSTSCIGICFMFHVPCGHELCVRFCYSILAIYREKYPST